MIGTEYVNEVIKTAFTFVEVVSDVRCKVGLDAVLANDDPVFFIAELRRRKPGRAVFLVEDAARFQNRERVVDTARLRQALL